MRMVVQNIALLLVGLSVITKVDEELEGLTFRDGVEVVRYDQWLVREEVLAFVFWAELGKGLGKAKEMGRQRQLGDDLSEERIATLAQRIPVSLHSSLFICVSDFIRFEVEKREKRQREERWRAKKMKW